MADHFSEILREPSLRSGHQRNRSSMLDEAKIEKGLHTSATLLGSGTVFALSEPNSVTQFVSTVSLFSGFSEVYSSLKDLIMRTDLLKSTTSNRHPIPQKIHQPKSAKSIVLLSIKSTSHFLNTSFILAEAFKNHHFIC
jgi:hypothetical protein